MNAFVYILRCADDKFYVGTTRGSLEHRVSEHNSGKFGGYTSSRRPVTLEYAECFDRIEDAISSERQLKGWSRAKKQALIDGRIELLAELSKRRRSFSA